MGYDAGVLLVWGVQVPEELSEEIIWRLFGDQIREHAVQWNVPAGEAFEDFIIDDMVISGTDYSYIFARDRDDVNGIFIALKTGAHWVIRTPDPVRYRIPPTPQEVETFINVLSRYGIGIGGQGDLPVSEYGLWTSVIGG